jgi:nitroreductase
MAVLHHLVTTRRSVRLYGPEPIPRERIRALIDAATHAPSNFNRQPWTPRPGAAPSTT